MSSSGKPPFDLSEMMGLMGQALQMKQDLEAAQKKVEAKTIEGQAGGGIVRVQVSGALKVLKITLDPRCVDPNEVGLLEDLLVAATNDALSRAHKLMDEETGKLAGGLDLSGMGGLLGGAGLGGLAGMGLGAFENEEDWEDEDEDEDEWDDENGDEEEDEDDDGEESEEE